MVDTDRLWAALQVIAGLSDSGLLGIKKKLGVDEYRYGPLRTNDELKAIAVEIVFEWLTHDKGGES